jgi:ABC-2 type transport system permease protein
MRAFGVMLSTSIRAFLRDRGAVFWGIAFPLILMGLLGLAFGRGERFAFTVSVVDEGNPQIAAPLLAGLQQVPVLDVIEEDRATALEQLRAGDRTLVVVVPAAGTALEAFYSQSQPQMGQAALTVLERFVAEANLHLAGAAPVLSVKPAAVEGKQLRFFDFLLPGILAMTIGQTGFLSVTYLVATMRENGLLKRVMATPVHPVAFLGGLVGRYTVTMLFQAAIVLLVGTLVFGAQVYGSLLGLAVLALVGAVCFFGLGFAVSTFSRTPEGANTLGSVVWFPMMFLSGTFWPREFMPDWLQPLIAYLPLAPLVDAMRGVSAHGEPVTNYLWAIVYMIVATVVAFAVASRRFRWE